MWPYFLSAMLITMLSLSLNLWVIPNATPGEWSSNGSISPKNAYIRYERHIYRQVYPGTFAYIRSYNGTTEKPPTSPSRSTKQPHGGVARSLGREIQSRHEAIGQQRNT